MRVAGSLSVKQRRDQAGDAFGYERMVISARRAVNETQPLQRNGRQFAMEFARQRIIGRCDPQNLLRRIAPFRRRRLAEAQKLAGPPVHGRSGNEGAGALPAGGDAVGNQLFDRLDRRTAAHPVLPAQFRFAGQAVAGLVFAGFDTRLDFLAERKVARNVGKSDHDSR